MVDFGSARAGYGDHVEIRKFGSLRVKKYKSCTGCKPKPGEKVKVKSKKLPSFKCGNEFRSLT